MFVKWECGCKGLHLDQGDFVIYTCDTEDGKLDFFNRGFMNEKSFVELPKDEIEKMVKEIRHLMIAGYGARKFKNALDHAWPPPKPKKEGK